MHKVICYLVIKRDKILIPATTWMNFENIILSEMGQIQKHRYCRFHLYEIPGGGKYIQIESTLEVTRALSMGAGWRELLLNGYRISVWGMKMFRK